MLIFLLLIFIAAVLFYCEYSWYLQKKSNVFLNISDAIEIANLGSTHAVYAFDYSIVNKRGYNLANIAQDLLVDKFLMEKYISNLAFNSKILLCFNTCIFLCDAPNHYVRSKVYYESFSPNEIKGFRLKDYFYFRWNACKEPILHTYRKSSEKWKGYIASEKEKEMHAKRRIEDWNSLNLCALKDIDASAEMKTIMSNNVEIVYQMIEICKKNNVEPIIVVPPISSILFNMLTQEVVDACLYKNIELIQSRTGIQVLNYQEDTELNSPELYLNSDCLTEKGRSLFMKKLVTDLKIC